MSVTNTEVHDVPRIRITWRPESHPIVDSVTALSAAQDAPGRVDDRVAAHAVVLEQLVRRSRLTEVVVHAHELDRNRAVRRQTLGNGRAHAGEDLMLFDRH